MRNEIFNQINQNRIQYYSELKNNNKDSKPKLNFQPEEKKQIKEYDKLPFVKTFAFPSFSKIDFSWLSIVFLSIQKQLSKLVSQMNKWIRKTNESITHKANIQSEKLTNSLSRISSQLFEDSYEFREPEERSTDNDKLTLSYSLINTSGVSQAIQYKQDEFRLLDQFIDWLNKVYRNIILFLESDSWFEEINRSQKSTNTIPKNHRYYNYPNNMRGYKLFFKWIVPKHVKNNPDIAESATKTEANSIGIYQKIIKQLKTLSTTLFPAINRFI